MENVKTKIQVTVLIVIVIAIVVLTVLMIKQNKVIANLKSEKDNIEVVKDKKFEKNLNQDEVKEYEKHTKSKLDAFLGHEYHDDSESDDGSAYKAMRGLFTVQSHKIVLDENSKHEDYLKYYSPFDYKIKNFSAQSDGKDVRVLFNIDTTYHKKEINDDYDLMTLTFDEHGKLKGGGLYAK
ncbi:hypothetical protein [Staphylococcus shinii]|uniref:hypothetical protein n=1 Tax=Staphylococcus shinii TaxID=2912228 RepID=UPI003EF05ADB